MLREWWEKYRRIAWIGGAVLFIGSSLWLYQAQSPVQSDESSSLPLLPPAYASEDDGISAASQPDAPDRSGEEPVPPASGSGKQAQQQAAPPALYVDVKGSVQQPGLYRLEAGMRVADAIAKAGGTKPDADLEQINLAAPLTDGTAIVIPGKGAPQSTAAPNPPIGLSSAAYTVGGSGSRSSDAGSVNINTASREQLMTLPGIGEARANAILQYREEKGGFRSLDELKEIQGIGEKMFERIKDRIQIR